MGGPYRWPETGSLGNTGEVLGDGVDGKELGDNVGSSVLKRLGFVYP